MSKKNNGELRIIGPGFESESLPEMTAGPFVIMFGEPFTVGDGEEIALTYHISGDPPTMAVVDFSINGESWDDHGVTIKPGPGVTIRKKDKGK